MLLFRIKTATIGEQLCKKWQIVWILTVAEYIKKKHSAYNGLNDTASSKDLTFIGYNYDHLDSEKVVSVLDFDRSKLLIESDGNTFKIFYNSTSFLIKIKKFCCLIKKAEI